MTHQFSTLLRLSNKCESFLLKCSRCLGMPSHVYGNEYSRTFATDVILLGWLPIGERIDFCIIKLAHKALCVTSFPSYLKLSFKKLSRYLRNKDEFLINNYYKNNNTFIGKARILFNNLPYQIRSISSFESFSRKVKKHLFDEAQAKYFQRH